VLSSVAAETLPCVAAVGASLVQKGRGTRSELSSVEADRLGDDGLSDEISKYDAKVGISLSYQVVIGQGVDPLEGYSANSNEAGHSREVRVGFFKTRSC
jgi:hypothetical protein